MKQDIRGKETQEKEQIENSQVTALDVSELVRGDMVRFLWEPEKMCLARYLGSGRWRVEESVRTRLRTGQEFFCRHIVEGEPLRMLLAPSERHQTGTVYVCGQRTGVRWEML